MITQISTAPIKLVPRLTSTQQSVRNTGAFNPPTSTINQSPTGKGFVAGEISKSPGLSSPNTRGQVSFGSKGLNVEKITKSISPQGQSLANLSQFGDEIASGVGKSISSNIDDIIGKASGLVGRIGGALGTIGNIGLAASIGAGIADFANAIDPAGKEFLNDFNWQTGRPNTPQPERVTSGFIPSPYVPSSPQQTPSKTPLGAPTGFPSPSPLGAPTSSPNASPTTSPSSPSTPASPGPTSKPFDPPGIQKPQTPGSKPSAPLPPGLGGVNLNLPIWQRLNNLEIKQNETQEPDLSPILKAMVKIGASIMEGVGGLIAPAATGVVFTSFLIDQVANMVKGLNLTSSFVIPQALTSSALIPNTLTSTALLPKTLTSTALLPKTLTSSALLPNTLTSTALIPNTLTSSAVIPQTLTKTAVIPQLLEAFFENPAKELEFDFNLGAKNLEFEIEKVKQGLEFEINLGGKEIEITIPQSKTNLELDVDLEPIKKEVEKCKDGHKKAEEKCKETGDNVKKIREKLEIEFPEIEGNGEIVCRDSVTPYVFKGKGLKGLQQMVDIQIGISKNILTHVCNGLQQQQDTISGALDYQLCEKTESGDIIITPNPYEGVGLKGIQAQINALANLNKYIITEVCKHENMAYPVYADPHLEEFPVLRQLTFTLVESRFYPYQEGSAWHMTIPLPKPGLVWADFEQFRFFKGTVFARIVWQNSKIWSGGYFRDEDEARRALTIMESYSTLSKSGDFRIGKGGNPRKPQVREVRAVRAVIADLNPTTGDPETVLTYTPPLI